MYDAADKMAAAIVKLTTGLAKDGLALEGFIDALNIQNEWQGLKLKRSMERMCRRAGVVENFAHEPVKEPHTEAFNKHNVSCRFFIDERVGCIAVRDRKHPQHDPDYPGLHNDTIDVVFYAHGNKNETGWYVDERFKKKAMEVLGHLQSLEKNGC
jgi:hypothetical protein